MIVLITVPDSYLHAIIMSPGGISHVGATLQKVNRKREILPVVWFWFSERVAFLIETFKSILITLTVIFILHLSTPAVLAYWPKYC